MAQIDGNGNISVHIDGDDNHVAIGLLPKLEITCYHSRRKRNSELDKLSPYSRYSPLLGRAAELASLQAFLQDERPLLCRVLIGGGGSGKTRLALELCEQASGWQAGFVTHKELARFMALQNLSAWGWQKPTLLVIDYAAAQAPLLATLLQELADRTHYPHPLRILLLERHASTESGWWQQVFASGGYAASSKLALLDPPEPVSLAPLYQVEDRLALLAAMLAGCPVKDFLAHADFQAQLKSLSWGGDPLYLMMAALGMRQHGAQVLTLNRTDLADLIASHEENRLVQLAHHLGDTCLLLHLVACVTLMQGMDYADFLDFAAMEKQALGRSHSGGDAAQLAELLQAALPREDGGIAPLLPDLIGEAWLLRTWKNTHDHAAILRAYQRHPQRVVPSLIRCAQDFYPQKTTPLNWLQAVLQSIQHDADALNDLYTNLYQDSVSLRDFNLQHAQCLVALPQQAPDVQAARHSNLSVAFAKMGQLEAALPVAQKAADLYRQLVEESPDVFQPNLARSLSGLANILGELGHREDALQAAQAATDLSRQLAEQRPDLFQADLATLLNNLAAKFSSLGEREAALQAAQESVQIRRQLAIQNSDVFLPSLANSLINISTMFGKLGQLEAALSAAQESTDLYRQLTAHRPDVYLPNLGVSLNNLTKMLGAQRQHGAALSLAKEATNLNRQLAIQHPEVFRSYLASSLNNLASSLRRQGQSEAGLAAAQEAADLYRQLMAKRPDVYQSDLAMSLKGLAILLRELGLYEVALQAVQEAVDLYCQLAAHRPDVFQVELAKALIVLALCTAENGEAVVAQQRAHEAVSALRADFLRRPVVFLGFMGAMLQDYLRLCQAAEQTPDMALLTPLLPYFSNPEE
ncbi:MAG: tetratricopeptide repeat protein [Gallionella sp.]|nr:tetratricopeptide repeat protein [Gallionella sp.]MDD4958533.1 tetratricopeptide repeat protein [Gallionella sp.]